MATSITSVIQHPIATDAAWTALNPVLLVGETVYVKKTAASTKYAVKVGDGVTSYSNLSYAVDYEGIVQQADKATAQATAATAKSAEAQLQANRAQIIADGLDAYTQVQSDIRYGSPLKVQGSGNPVTLDGTSEDHRLIELEILGESVQDGTPSPTAPVAIKSVEPVVNVAGRNLADIKSYVMECKKRYPDYIDNPYIEDERCYIKGRNNAFWGPVLTNSFKEKTSYTVAAEIKFNEMVTEQGKNLAIKYYYTDGSYDIVHWLNTDVSWSIKALTSNKSKTLQSVYLTFGNSSANYSINLDKFMLAEGTYTAATMPWEPHLRETRVDDRNLFKKNPCANEIIRASTGVAAMADGGYATPYVQINNQNYVCYTCRRIGSTIYGIAFYDDNKTYISGLVLDAALRVIPIPESAKYLRATAYYGYSYTLYFSDSVGNPLGVRADLGADMFNRLPLLVGGISESAGIINSNPGTTYWRYFDYLEVNNNTYVTYNGRYTLGSLGLAFYTAEKVFLSFVSAKTTRQIIAIPSGTSYVRACYFTGNNGGTDFEFYFSDAAGNPVEPWASLSGIKDSNGNFIARDRVYRDKRGNWWAEQNVKNYVVTGTEEWRPGGASTLGFKSFYLQIQTMKITNQRDDVLCSHVPLTTISLWDNPTGAFCIGGRNESVFNISISTENAADLNSFKSYLAAQHAAGTPVTVTYALANPTTTQITDPYIITQLNALVSHDGQTNIWLDGDTGALDVTATGDINYALQEIKTAIAALATV